MNTGVSLLSGPRLLGALLLAALAASPAAGQTGAEDSGTFRVSLEGREAGTEEFTIRQTGVGANSEVIASGRISLRLATGTLELVPRLRATGLQAAPVAYQIDIGGTSPRKIVGNVGNGRFSAKIVTGSGEQLREYVASAGAIILEDGVAHHYYFLAQRLRNGRVPILIPRENRQVMATVSSRGEEQVSINGKTVSLFHLVVQPDGGAERHAWVDALNRVIRVDIPQMGYSAVRTEIPR